MNTTNATSQDTTSAHTALDGYWYQLKVSILFALDLLAHRQLTDQIVLEPVSEEDLEADIEDEPGALAQNMPLKTRQLVVQCKLRSTGPWKIKDIATLLAHGTRRKSAKDRLKDPNVNYLLVTSADLFGDARNLAVSGPGQWQRLKKMPVTISKNLPEKADGRVAVWSRLDTETVEYRIKDILTNRFRIPTSKVAECMAKLEAGALARMKGAGAGVWTRDDVIRIIIDHDGYDGVSKDLLAFVPPTNWDELQDQLDDMSAIVLTGPSGTGKTTTAKALIAKLRDTNPHMRHARISGGPESIRADTIPGSVVYEVEDPWGKYRAEPTALPWNDEINSILDSATPDRRFVITSRSDVLVAAELKTLNKRYTAELSHGHYRKADRSTLFDNRLKTLPRGEQVSTLKYKGTVVKQLLLPLEIDRFFGSAALGPNADDDENEATFMHRCIDQAKQEFIETSLISGIKSRDDWEQAAVIWALMKAHKRITFGALEDLEPELYDRLPALEDKLLPLVGFLVAGGNFKQDVTEISCAHPRVEAGLEAAALEKPSKSSRVLGYLIEALNDLDDVTGTDWGVETAVQIRAITSEMVKLRLRISPAAQEKIDAWLTQRLSSLETSFRDDIALAVKAGSKDCAVAELARWLDDSPVDREWFNMSSWKEPERSQEWYDWISTEPHTHAICDAFVERIVGFRNGSYSGDFHTAIARLSPNLTPSFKAGISAIIGHGYNPNAETLIDGAIVDINGFEAVVLEAADFSDKSINSHDRKFWLAMYNRDYDDHAIDHYSEQAGEDGDTAGEVLKAYADARRSTGDWQSLANHPRRASLVWEWINCASRGEADIAEPELTAISDAARNHRHEDLFWNLANKQFNQSLSGQLEVRLREGSEDRDVRASAVRVALNQMPRLIDQLLSPSSQLSVDRTLEIALDIISALEGDEIPVAEQRTLIEKTTSHSSPEIAQAIGQLLGFNSSKPSTNAVRVLQSIDESARIDLNLAVAKALFRNGEESSSRVRKILTTSYDVSSENIELVRQAMVLAVKLNDQSLISVGLKHEFARCRVTAMNAVFATTSSPLSQNLLELRRDDSSLVRKRLVEMLEERPHGDHTDVLINLTFDTWTPDQHHHGYTVNYPIADKAAELLLEQPGLSDDQYQEVINSLRKTDNNDVRQTLLQTMVRHGSPDRRDKIVKIAVGDGRPTYQSLSAKALFFERDHVKKRQIDLIEDERIAAVSPTVACWLVLLLIESASDKRILQLASSLSTNLDRAVLLALMFLVTFGIVQDHLNENLGKLLADDKCSAIRETLGTRDTSELSYLDELGDVRMVEAVKGLFRVFFK